MKLVKVIFRGRSPLLQNRVQEQVLLGLDDKSTKTRSTGEKKGTPRERCEKLIHIADNGHPAITGDAFFSCLRNAGRFVKLDGKRQISTVTSTVLPSFLSVMDAFMPLFDPHDGSAASWEVDMRRGVNPNGGEMVCITRPRFDRWAFAARLLMNETEVAEAIVRKLVDLAGASVGLYDNRPARGGTNGQFEVVRWEVEAESSSEAATMKMDWAHLPEFAKPGLLIGVVL